MYYEPSVNRMYQATYLPEVMIEQRWNKYEAISSVLRKGGFKGKITDQVRRNLQVTRYQSARGAMTYNQYLKWKGLLFYLILLLLLFYITLFINIIWIMKY